MQSRKRLLKVMVLGDAGVGKTSLLNQYVKKQFSFQYKATIGADFLTKTIILDGSEIQLQIWDTAGQEKFNTMGPAFYRNSECCALVFDLTDLRTFETIESWRSGLITKLNPEDPDSFPFILIGNKSDKEGERKIQKSKIEQYCSMKGNMLYFETSAKDDINVDKSFEELANLALNRDRNIYDDKNDKIKPLVLNKQKDLKNTSKGCCK